MKALRLLLVPVIVLTLWMQTGMASALGCNGDVEEINTPAGTLYVDNRGIGLAGGLDVWIYLESNGNAGLQSGGQHVILGDFWSVDQCGDPRVADTLVF